jgi:transposase InsO family protein
VDRALSDIELHTAGATVRHVSPFAKVVVPVTDERINEVLRDRWVIPLYMRVLRGGGNNNALQSALARLRDEIDLPVVTSLLSYFDWRPRIVAAWLAAVRELTTLDDHIGRLLVRSDVCYAGRTFLRNRASQVWACDFFTVVTVHFQTLYAFVVISLERRKIVHVGVTAHPTGAWVAQRMVEAVGDAPPRYLLRDRDSIYDERFRARLRGLGVRCLLSPPRAPLANAICERLVGTLRRDCLDHVLVLSERYAERILREYVPYYHGRPHRSLRIQPPTGPRWLAPARAATPRELIAIPVLGGLHHRYAFPSVGPSPPP